MLVELSVMEQRYQAVLAVVQDGWKVTEVAERLGVSRQSVHAWITRYEQGGLAALADLSHRPTTCLWGAFIRFTLVSRAFGPGAEPEFGPWKAPEIRRRTRRHPFEVEREALRVGPRVLNRTRPSRPVVAPLGNSHPPHPMSCPPASKDTWSAARSQ